MNDNIDYNTQNIHPRDKKITFFGDQHKYVIEGKEIISVSTIISQFFSVFDREYWAMRKASQMQMTPEQVIDMWDEKGKQAIAKGDFMHKQIENFYLGKPVEESTDTFIFRQFTDKHKHLIPYRTEWPIFDDKYPIAGTIDLLAKNGEAFEIYDWKRSTNVVNIYGQPIKESPYSKKANGVISHLDDCSYIKYALQQSMYKYILETNYGLNIANMFLVVIHPKYDRYYKISLPYLKKEVVDILETLV